MGATAWKYFVPYNENVQEALESLKLQEFEAGRYGKNDNVLAAIEKQAAQMNLPADKLEEFKIAYQDFAKLKSKSKKPPASIKQLLKKSADSGTHSIIDIAEIECTTDKNVSGTLSAEDAIVLFGTDKPTHEMVKSKADQLINYRGRGLCTYVVVYDHDEPVELFFAGYSGD